MEGGDSLPLIWSPSRRPSDGSIHTCTDYGVTHLALPTTSEVLLTVILEVIACIEGDEIPCSEHIVPHSL